MTIDELKGFLCSYFNGSSGFSVPFIKAPTNSPAPKGTYIAVRVESVNQSGSLMQPNKGEGYHVQNVASIAFIEVEGDGDVLRQVRNALQMQDFCEYCNSKGFSVWTIGQLIEVPSYDGEFYVRQWRLAIQVNFCDDIAGDVEKIWTVDVGFLAEEDIPSSSGELQEGPLGSSLTAVSET